MGNNLIEETRKLQNDQLELMMEMQRENESLKNEMENMKKWSYILLKHLGGSVDVPDKFWRKFNDEQKMEVKIDIFLPDKIRIFIEE